MKFLLDIEHGKSLNNINVLYPEITNKRLNTIPESFFRIDDNGALDSPRHCYVHDHVLEFLWKNHHNYFENVLCGDFAISPDFTVYLDAPLVLAVYQVWRSRSIARFWQENGVFVIPTIHWSRTEINEHLFKGLENCEVVAIRTAKKGSEKAWLDAVLQFQEMIKPKLVLQFGTSKGIGAWKVCEVLNVNVGNRSWILNKKNLTLK